MKIQKA